MSVSSLIRSHAFAALALLVALAASSNAQSTKVLYSFQGPPTDGAAPAAGLISDRAGNLYGTTQYGGNGTCTSSTYPAGCGTVFKLSPPASKGGPWVETILHHFQGSADGAYPLAALIFDKAGNLYGEAALGGSSGFGTVFKLTRTTSKNSAWTQTILYNFLGSPVDGSLPQGGLIFDATGNLFGTTREGGAGANDDGCGTAFELSPPATSGGTWAEAVLYTFTGNTKVGGYNGCWPITGVILDQKGNVYGTTLTGGTGFNYPLSLGIIFQLAPPTNPGDPWTESVLYNFGGGGSSGLIMDGKGSLYGSEGGGGRNLCDPSKGTLCGDVFQLVPPAQISGTWTYNDIYDFQLANNSNLPIGNLISGRMGTLVGATINSVYKLVPPSSQSGQWTETVFQAFTPSTDGARAAGVIFDPAHLGFFGTTSNGGPGTCTGNWGPGCGTVYQVVP